MNRNLNINFNMEIYSDRRESDDDDNTTTTTTTIIAVGQRSVERIPPPHHTEMGTVSLPASSRCVAFN